MAKFWFRMSEILPDDTEGIRPLRDLGGSFGREVRPVSILRISKLRFADSDFPVNPAWAWEFHPLNIKILLELNPLRSIMLVGRLAERGRRLPDGVGTDGAVAEVPQLPMTNRLSRTNVTTCTVIICGKMQGDWPRAVGACAAAHPESHLAIYIYIYIYIYIHTHTYTHYSI